MRTLYTYSFLALTFAAVASAQIVLDPSPARVAGHPSTTPAEQLLVTNLNPNLGVNGGLFSPQGVAVDTSGSTPIANCWARPDKWWLRPNASRKRSCKESSVPRTCCSKPPWKA